MHFNVINSHRAVCSPCDLQHQPAPRAVLCCGCCVRQTAGHAGCQGLIANALPDVTAFLIAFPITCVSMRLSETCNKERQTSLQAEIAHKSISSEECVRSKQRTSAFAFQRRNLTDNIRQWCKDEFCSLALFISHLSCASSLLFLDVCCL